MPEPKKNYIALEDCKHGYTYRIHSRNLSLGVFNQETQGFVGIREKFGSFYLFTEFHYDTGAPFGTVRPHEEIEKCPIEDLREHLGTECQTCRKHVKFVRKAGNETGQWIHLEPIDCKEARPVAVSNTALYQYLEKPSQEAAEKSRKEWEETLRKARDKKKENL